jgi:hypothetical protein
MNKNTNPMNDIINDFTEKFGDNEVQMTFRDVKEGMDSYFSLISMTADLIKLIREEETLRKHHRAYLHVREDILESSNELMAFMNAALMKCGEGKHIGYIPKSEYNDGYPFAVVDEDDEDALVVIAKSDYDGLIEDILTLAELVTMVTEMRTRDLKSIKELSKFIPAFASFEHNRISVYKDARFEADEIIDRLEEMEVPYEYFSD